MTSHRRKITNDGEFTETERGGIQDKGGGGGEGGGGEGGEVKAVKIRNVLTPEIRNNAATTSPFRAAARGERCPLEYKVLQAWAIT